MIKTKKDRKKIQREATSSKKNIESERYHWRKKSRSDEWKMKKNGEWKTGRMCICVYALGLALHASPTLHPFKTVLAKVLESVCNALLEICCSQISFSWTGNVEIQNTNGCNEKIKASFELTERNCNLQFWNHRKQFPWKTFVTENRLETCVAHEMADSKFNMLMQFHFQSNRLLQF